LHNLDLCITKSNLPYTNILFSPHLKQISISISLLWGHSRISHDALQVIASTISALPTFNLQSLQVSPTTLWVDLEGSLSSIVLRCGPSLTEFVSMVPLSDAAVNHLIWLPHLHTCCIKGPPPSHSSSDLPLVFPPLKKFTLGGGAAGKWLSLLQLLGNCVAPLSKVKESLKSLDPAGATIDGPFTSLIQTFWNLVNLNVDVSCHARGGGDRCIFELNNDDVTELASALPHTGGRGGLTWQVH